MVTQSASGNFTYTLTCTGSGGSANNSATLTTGAFPMTSATTALLPFPAPPLPNPPLTGALSKVTSYMYLDGANPATPGINTAIANSPSSLIILGEFDYSVPLDRAAADPTGTKFFLGYVDATEANAYLEPELFTNGTVPSWFGNTIPGYTGISTIYSVQYWNPNWESALFTAIDEILAQGFDGVFLDVLNGDNEWSAGNSLGNSVYPAATSALATLLSDIRNYVNRNYPGKTVYLGGNEPQNVAVEFPASLKNLDVIFWEELYYQTSVSSNMFTSHYVGTSTANYVSSTTAPAFQTANILILGNDYPTPLTAENSLPTFEFYSDLGWIPSVTISAGSDVTLTTGPFMFMATANNPTVTGTPNFPNLLSGGTAPNVTLIGGPQGDYFIGGPGQNTITAGAGNDTIYAHPGYSTYKNHIVFTVASTVEGTATMPSISISINGSSPSTVTPITAAFGTSSQVFSVDVSSLSSVTSAIITVSGASYSDQNNFSNMEIESVIYNGAGINLASATYSNGASSPNYTYSNDGTVSFPASSFAVKSPYLSNTSDMIDGGGGTNIVVYRSDLSNYTITKNSDGSVTVVGNATAEGPDTLKNVQILQFSDQQMMLQ
jgi:hypothetical protein